MTSRLSVIARAVEDPCRTAKLPSRSFDTGPKTPAAHRRRLLLVNLERGERVVSARILRRSLIAGARVGPSALPTELVEKLNDRGRWRAAELVHLAERVAAMSIH